MFRIKWGSIVIAGLSVWVISFVLVAATVFAYAFSLGLAARGAPDFTAIQRFAEGVGPVWGPRISALLTGIAAIWLARRVNAWPIWHGVLVGVVVAGPGLLAGQRFGMVASLLFAATLLAGAAGGWLGSHRKEVRLQQ